MDNKYICDDRNVLENAQQIRNMTDEEWENYVKSHQKSEDDETSFSTDT